MEKPIAARAFEPGVSVTQPDGDSAVLSSRTIADLAIPSYRLVACDPFECTLATPFAYRVTPGRYPVVLAFADFGRTADQRIAAAMLRLSDTEPVRWEPAFVEDGGEASTSTFGVDSGLCALLSDEAVGVLADRLSSDGDYMERAIEDQRGPLYTGGPEWFDIELDPSTGLNMVICTSGWGDGLYSGYWGIDDDGNLVCLVIDLCVLDERDEISRTA